MKRILTILVVLFLVLGGLFWWRLNSNALDYQTYNPKIIPLVNNYTATEDNSTELPLIFLENHSNYSFLFGPRDTSSQTFLDLIQGKSNPAAFGYAVNNFNIINKRVYFGIKNSTEFYYRDLPLHFKKYGYDTKWIEIPEPHNLELKTFNEWLTLWKSEGKLPWFP